MIAPARRSAVAVLKRRVVCPAQHAEQLAFVAVTSGGRPQAPRASNLTECVELLAEIAAIERDQRVQIEGQRAELHGAAQVSLEVPDVFPVYMYTIGSRRRLQVATTTDDSETVQFEPDNLVVVHQCVAMHLEEARHDTLLMTLSTGLVLARPDMKWRASKNIRFDSSRLDDRANSVAANVTTSNRAVLPETTAGKQAPIDTRLGEEGKVAANHGGLKEGRPTPTEDVIPAIGVPSAETTTSPAVPSEATISKHAGADRLSEEDVPAEGTEKDSAKANTIAITGSRDDGEITVDPKPRPTSPIVEAAVAGTPGNGKPADSRAGPLHEVEPSCDSGRQRHALSLDLRKRRFAQAPESMRESSWKLQSRLKAAVTKLRHGSPDQTLALDAAADALQSACASVNGPLVQAVLTVMRERGTQHTAFVKAVAELIKQRRLTPADVLPRGKRVPPALAEELRNLETEV
ncbi:hypothetical protein DIPPA_20882 [Diplonema papillatum]|nr:hypothetical protein DIPPA_20882 [Diplonema papillatum]